MSDLDRRTRVYYETDLVNVENTIRHWYAGDTVFRDPNERILTRPILSQSQPSGEILWLLSNDLEVGMNINGTKIVANYTAEWMRDNIYMLSAEKMEEVLNHVHMIKDLYPEITVWPLPVWFLFPMTTELDELIVPF
jgi:hypothetical protein